jgi:hypothetical protein
MASGSASFAGADGGDATEGFLVVGTATLGVMGTIGTTGRVAVRVCDGEELGRPVDNGVVGTSPEPISEGAWEVAGVSWSEGAATVEVWDSVVCSSIVSPASGELPASSITSSCPLEGNMTNPASCGCLAFFGPRFLGVRGGNGLSGTEYHGNLNVLDIGSM